MQQYVVSSGINTQYIVMFNVLLGCTHFEQMIKQKYLCNITTDLHLKHFLDHCRRLLKASVKPGKREPMGRRASLVASGMDTGRGVYISPYTRRVSTPSSRKIKKSLLQQQGLKIPKNKKEFPMAEIAIATRQAISLNGFSARNRVQLLISPLRRV